MELFGLFGLFGFIVEGEGPFPTEMLCFDQCWPALEGDALKIPYSPPRSGLQTLKSRKRRTIKLIGLHTPSAERWAEFGWRVSNVIFPQRKVV